MPPLFFTMATYQETDSLIAWLPDLIFTGGRFQSGLALVCDSSGIVVKLAPVNELRNERRIILTNRAILPGLINSHSHAFQRVLRGRTEYRSHDVPFSGGLLPAELGGSPTLNAKVSRDSFWTWREMMYSAATRLTPEDIYDASRMAFLEMALNGITAVGEFHYLQHQPDGTPYDDPNLLAREVVRAARDVGVRIALLRVAYARSGFQTEPNPRQARFIETDPESYLRNLQRLIDDVARGTSPTAREGSSTQPNGALPNGQASAPPPSVWVGVAPHSVRAVPLDYLKEIIAHARRTNLKIHMHVAEQPAEVSACVEEYGRSPIALLQTEGLLSEHFTAVHAIHVTAKAIAAFAPTGAVVCACPTTERNLGDGVVPADEYFKRNVAICLGTDSHAQIDLLEDARELEYHLRLQKLERAVLDRGSSPTPGPPAGQPGRGGAVREGVSPDDAASHKPLSLAALLFDCATINGARSIGAPSGTLEVGKAADFFTVALDDPSIAGATPEHLLASIVFSLERAAVREVVVSGKPIVSEGQHLIQGEIVERFIDLQKRLWT